MKRFSLLPILLLTSISSYAQSLAYFTVKAGKVKRDNSIVYTTIGNLQKDSLLLEEEIDGKRREVPFSIQGTQLSWVLSGETLAGKERKYILSKGHGNKGTRMNSVVSGGHLLLEEGKQPILQYNFQTTPAPAGVDTLYNRNAYIHPLWAPNGVVLTNIFPNVPHMHHMGIWNPWTHTLFEGRETDFWNIQKKEGKVKWAGELEAFSGNVWCGFRATQDHIAFLSDGREKTAIHETWMVKAYPVTHNGERRLWDFSTTFTPATPSGITLLQYRYGGGFGLRTTAAFTAKTSQVLTSEGKTRKDADSTRARWVNIYGTTPDGKAGMLIMNYPDNFDSPEPVRVWPEDMEGGELMFNFSPTKMKNWQLSPGSRYQLKYRVLVYGGEITVEEAEAAWQDYVYPVEVTVEFAKQG
ncbi:hypothetical protein DVR12_07475 [Chitinophaga silvatica]|uniref:Methane oxygenase PmoA n=1 Tax=Chitinophaga silvatica TaxID=2282649 RepID=A0A3E1YFC5_9BACT|nr:PmoA family protein [Chitinophaga silvatica]RFS25017.1 hypothetical protein DVR12_07475 [Chitinophaga silvatica]